MTWLEIFQIGWALNTITFMFGVFLSSRNAPMTLDFFIAMFICAIIPMLLPYGMFVFGCAIAIALWLDGRL